jgi:hypothetical protein
MTSPQQDDLQNDREGLTHILKEWDLSRVRPKEIFEIMQKWGRIPNYHHLSSKALFPHSSMAQSTDSSSPELNILEKFNSLTSVAKKAYKVHLVHLENISIEIIQYKEADYGIYETETSETTTTETPQEETRTTPAEAQGPAPSTPSSNFKSREKETLAVSRHFDHPSEDSSFTLYSRLINWLSNFTLTPVHFCKCVDNCNCSD